MRRYIITGAVFVFVALRNQTIAVLAQEAVDEGCTTAPPR